MKTNINRRRFLSLSAIAGTGALMSPIKAIPAINRINESTKMPTRVLGNTGLVIPILSMGVMRVDNLAVVRAAYNSGITHFDTAHAYQNGKNEEMLGVFFKDKPRDSFTITTKGKVNYPLTDTFEKDYAELMETSLRRLQMDHVDIFYSHAVETLEPVSDERILAMLKKFKAEGKTRFIGLSTHANKPEQIDAAIKTGVYDVILLSYNFKISNLEEINAAIERGIKAGIGFVAMKTMTGGTEGADGQKKINGAACLKWVWKNEHFTTAIPGFNNFDMLDDCLSAANNPQLSPSDEKYIAGLCNNEMLYCTNCGKCIAQCTEHLPIPDIMRAYMYNYGYKHATLSKETLAELNLPDKVCASCNSCSVTCTSGFNVAQKIAAISPLRYVSNDFLA